MSSARSAALSGRRLMILITLTFAVFVLFFPARQLVHQREQVSALEQRLSALRGENRRLSEEVARLSDPAETELLVRERLGLVRPGERAYFVQPTEVPKAATVHKADPPSWWSRMWSRLGSRLRSLVRGRG